MFAVEDEWYSSVRRHIRVGTLTDQVLSVCTILSLVQCRSARPRVPAPARCAAAREPGRRRARTLIAADQHPRCDYGRGARCRSRGGHRARPAALGALGARGGGGWCGDVPHPQRRVERLREEFGPRRRRRGGDRLRSHRRQRRAVGRRVPRRHEIASGRLMWGSPRRGWGASLRLSVRTSSVTVRRFSSQRAPRAFRSWSGEKPSSTGSARARTP